MGVKDVVGILRRGWLLILLTIALLLGLAAAVNQLAPRSYAATSQIYLSVRGAAQLNDLVQGSSFAQAQVATYANLVLVPDVLESAREDLGLEEDTDSLADRISATPLPGTVLIDVTVTDDDPQAAADLANAVSGHAVELLDSLNADAQEGASTVQAQVVRSARPDPDPTFPRPLLNYAVALLLGLLLGPLVAVVAQSLNTKVQGRRDLERLLPDVPLLGAIPADGATHQYPLITQAIAHSPRVEAFRTLRTNLQFLDATHAPRSVVVTSSIAGEGKTSVAVNLALTLAEAGVQVCLVEADLRRPRVTHYLGLVEGAGLTSVIINQADIDDVLQAGAHPGLSVLACGPIPPNPSELLASPRAAEIFGELAERFEMVIIDATPLLPVTDGSILAALADGTLLVVAEGDATSDHVKAAVKMLASVNARLLGLVLNRSRSRGRDTQPYYFRDTAPEISQNRKTQRDRELVAERVARRARGLLSGRSGQR